MRTASTPHRPSFVWILALLVLGGTGFLMGIILFGEPPDFQGAERRKLEGRIEEYKDLRLGGDWSRLYELTDPEERELVDLKDFLNYYDHGVLRVHRLTTGEVAVDPVRRTAVSSLATLGEIVPASLPEPVRRGFREEHPEHLQREADLRLEWVWREGTWYFRMDPELVSRRDPRGNAVAPLPRKNG